MTDRSQARRQLGSAAVLSEAEAVALLPCRDSTAREWLRDRGLVRTTGLGKVVIWGEVLEALRGHGAPADPQPRPPSKLPRAGLRR